MEWLPKLLDDIDSNFLALHQSWAGYYRWVWLRLTLTIVGATVLTASPMIRVLAIAGVVSFGAADILDRLIARIRGVTAART